MAVRGTRVVSVPVSDQERAKSFYVDQLGMRVVRDDASMPGLRWVQVAPGDGTTSLVLVTWFDSMPAGSLRGLVLTCDDLEVDCAAMADRGMLFESPVQQQPWGLEAVVRDPDGNQIVLQQA